MCLFYKLCEIHIDININGTANRNTIWKCHYIRDVLCLGIELQKVYNSTCLCTWMIAVKLCIHSLS